MVLMENLSFAMVFTMKENSFKFVVSLKFQPSNKVIQKLSRFVDAISKTSPFSPDVCSPDLIYFEKFRRKSLTSVNLEFIVSGEGRNSGFS